MKTIIRSQIILILLVGPLVAQDISVNSLLPTINSTALEIFDDQVWVGTKEGGLLNYSDLESGIYQQYTTADGLSGNSIIDLAWTGEYLWAVCKDADLTRLDVSGNQVSTRRVTAASDFPITSVVGWSDGSNEKVYYGLQGGGVGFINSSLPGNVYSTETSFGLVSDDVICLEYDGTTLWIGTSEGISTFSGNVFTDISLTLPDERINDLYIDPAGDVYAATASGVVLWNADLEEWELLGTMGNTSSVTSCNGQLYALRFSGTTSSILLKYESESWVGIAEPGTYLSKIAPRNSVLITTGKENPEDSHSQVGHLFISRLIDDSWETEYTENIIFFPAGGVDFTSDGDLWVGSWLGRGFSRWDGTEWLQFFQEVEDPALEGPGLIDFGGNFLTVAVSEMDNLWASQFTKGLITYNSDTGDCAHIKQGNSVLRGNRIVKIVSHPDGPLLFCSDQDGVDILLDEANWDNSENWLFLSTEGDQLNGNIIRDAAVGQNGHIWFAVENVGIVLWDCGFSNGSPTWTDTQDDVWSAPLIALPGSLFSFAGTQAISVADDGTIWAAGGSGIVHFQLDGYGSHGITATHLQTFREKVDSYTDGLLFGSISEIDIDNNGDIWAAHGAGTNRIRLRGDDIFIDSYTSYQDYIDYGFGVLYSAGVISGLPGGRVRRVACNIDARQVAVSGERGVMLIEVTPESANNSGPLDNLYLYPNPLYAGSSSIKLGGVDAEVSWDNYVPSGGVSVEIFNLTGQSVYKNGHVEGDTPLWDGTLRNGSLVAPGVYQVRLEIDGQILIKPLAIVR